MPKAQGLDIFCPKCGKRVGVNINAIGTIELYCKSCKQAHLIRLTLN